MGFLDGITEACVASLWPLHPGRLYNLTIFISVFFLFVKCWMQLNYNVITKPLASFYSDYISHTVCGGIHFSRVPQDRWEIFAQVFAKYFIRWRVCGCVCVCACVHYGEVWPEICLLQLVGRWVGERADGVYWYESGAKRSGHVPTMTQCLVFKNSTIWINY